MSRSRTRVVVVSAAVLGLVVAGGLAAVAVGLPPVPAPARLVLPTAAPPSLPLHRAMPVTTPPAPAPWALAEAARAAASATPVPACATTRPVVPAPASGDPTAVTGDDAQEGCPQSRGGALTGALWGP